MRDGELGDEPEHTRLLVFRRGSPRRRFLVCARLIPLGRVPGSLTVVRRGCGHDSTGRHRYRLRNGSGTGGWGEGVACRLRQGRGRILAMAIGPSGPWSAGRRRTERSEGRDPGGVTDDQIRAKARSSQCGGPGVAAAGPRRPLIEACLVLALRSQNGGNLRFAPSSPIDRLRGRTIGGCSADENGVRLSSAPCRQCQR